MLATLRQRDFALLWVAGLVSVAGDYALIVALPLHAYALTGSAAATGGVFAAALLPRILLGSVAGVFVDRWDRKRTLVVTDLLRALLLLPLLLVVSADLLWLLFAVRSVVGLLGLLFEPAESALLPRLVGEERLVTANALNALNDNLGRLIGPACGGVLYAAGGVSAVVLVDAATFFISALLILAIRTSTRPAPVSATGEAPRGSALIAEWRAGLRTVGRSPTLRAVFAGYGLGTLGEGTFAVGFTPLVVDVLAGGARGVGLILSAQAIGGLAAGVLVARVAGSISPGVLFAGGLIGLGLADLGLANVARLAPPGQPAVLVAAGFMILAGGPVVASMAAGRGLLQTWTADAYRGRVFGALGTVQGIATLAGLAVGGAAVDAIGIVPVVSAGAAMWIVGGVIAWLLLPRDAPDPLLAVERATDAAD
jgi:MFS family permease